MTTYKKLIATHFTNDFRDAAQIVEAELTDPAPDEIIIRNRYAGVNATDVNITTGSYTPGQQPPIDLGVESVGEVIAVGTEVTTFRVGDHAMAMRVGGGYREYLPIKARYAVPVPDSTPEILSLILSGLTASFGLDLVGEMGTGETVLVTAAAGGTGHIAVQLAKLAGNHVIGTCSSAEKADFLKSIGCDRVVNYKVENLADVLRKEYPRGVDLVYESVGREMFDAAVENLALRGRLVIIGYISEYLAMPERITQPRIYTQLLGKSASIRGMFLNHFFKHMPEHMQKLTALLQAGQLRIEIDPTEFRGVESVVAAVEYLHSGRNNGKVVIRY
ncbi:MAG: hypothetical protein OHK0046_35510 [Anaerolineae bacterium]